MFDTLVSRDNTVLPAGFVGEPMYPEDQLQRAASDNYSGNQDQEGVSNREFVFDGEQATDSLRDPAIYVNDEDDPDAPFRSSGGARLFDCHKYKTFDFGDATFDVVERYEPKEVIGCGAYGVVCSAFDRGERKMIAIKKVEIIFEHKTYLKRLLRE
eukprot:233029_1